MGMRRIGKYKIKNPEKYSGNCQNIIYRSGWEYDVMRYFDESTGVLKWASEEMFITYYNPVTKKINRYFPDFVTKSVDKEGKTNIHMIEVKPLKQCSEPQRPKHRITRKYKRDFLIWKINEAKFMAAHKFCKENGMIFKILTEKDIYKIRKKING